jgi:hypothetical protein
LINPESFFSWYENTGWKDRDGKQIKNWKNKAQSWNTNEKKKNPQARPYSKPINAKEKTVSLCPKCGVELRNMACPQCFTNYDLEGNEL